MKTTTEHAYIVRDPAILYGEPVVKGTRTPVRAVVENWRLGLSPEEIVVHLPHLTPAQVFDAGYYSNHQDEIEAYIEKNQIPKPHQPVHKMISADEDVDVLIKPLLQAKGINVHDA
jgi:uncharacterized protein (DUF433 family)